VRVVDEQIRPTGKSQFIDVTGMHIPWGDGQPAMLTLAGMSAFDLYVPIFSNIDQLRTIMELTRVPYAATRTIKNQREFWESVPKLKGNFIIHVIVDLHVTPEGKARWSEVFRS
jgi:hypothetical protein